MTTYFLGTITRHYADGITTVDDSLIEQSCGLFSIHKLKPKICVAHLLHTTHLPKLIFDTLVRNSLLAFAIAFATTVLLLDARSSEDA